MSINYLTFVEQLLSMVNTSGEHISGCLGIFGLYGYLDSAPSPILGYNVLAFRTMLLGWVKFGTPFSTYHDYLQGKYFFPSGETPWPLLPLGQLRLQSSKVGYPNNIHVLSHTSVSPLGEENGFYYGSGSTTYMGSFCHMLLAFIGGGITFSNYDNLFSEQRCLPWETLSQYNMRIDSTDEEDIYDVCTNCGAVGGGLDGGPCCSEYSSSQE